MEPFIEPPYFFSRAQEQLSRLTAYRDAITATAIAYRNQTEGAIAAARRYHDMMDRLAHPLAVWQNVMPPVRVAPRKPRVRNFRDLPSIRGDWV